MSITYSYQDGVLYTAVKEQLTVKEISNYFDAVIKDPLVKNVEFELVTMEPGLEYQFSYNDTTNVAQLYSRMKEAKNISRTIFVAADDSQFGMSRMLATIISEVVEVSVVRSLEEAHQLLSKK